MSPYVKRERRGEVPETAGELNYAITRLLVEYIERKGEFYQTYNDIIEEELELDKTNGF